MRPQDLQFPGQQANGLTVFVPVNSRPAIVGLFLALVSIVVVCMGADQPKADEGLQIPPAVLQTLKSRINGGKVTSVNVDEDDGEKSFDFQIIAKDGTSQGITIAEDGHIVSVQVTLEQTPPLVQQKIRQQLGKSKLLGISMTTEKGAQSYEVGMKLDDKEHTITIESDGTISSREVFLDETPSSVQKTIREQVGKNELLGIDEVPEEDDIAFSVEVDVKGTTRSFTVGRDGALLESEIEFSALPAAVQNAANANRGKNEIQGAVARFDNDQASYEIELSSPDGARTLTFQPSGALTSLEIPFAEAPPVIQKAITAHLGGGTLESIEKIVEGGAASYEVEIGGAHKAEFTLEPDGSMPSRRVFPGAVPAPVQAAAKKIIGAGFILRIDQSLGETLYGVLPYTVHGRRDYHDFDFLLGPDGTYLGMDE